MIHKPENLVIHRGSMRYGGEFPVEVVLIVVMTQIAELVYQIMPNGKMLLSWISALLRP